MILTLIGSVWTLGVLCGAYYLSTEDYHEKGKLTVSGLLLNLFCCFFWPVIFLMFIPDLVLLRKKA